MIAFGFSGVAKSQSLLINGGFETGTTTGWSITSQAGSPGTFHVTNANQTPFEQYPTPGAAVGSFYAVTDSNAPGTDNAAAYSMIQSFIVPNNTNFITVQFKFFAQDWWNATAESGNGTLDYTQLGVAQFARADLLRAGAAPFSVAALDLQEQYNILANGQALTNPASGWTTVTKGTLVTPGQTYQLRFASVQNQFSFNLGVDDVSVTASVVPEPGTALYCAVALLFLPLKRRILSNHKGN
jgi:hypothetical protein